MLELGATEKLKELFGYLEIDDCHNCDSSIRRVLCRFVRRACVEFAQVAARDKAII